MFEISLWHQGCHIIAFGNQNQSIIVNHTLYQHVRHYTIVTSNIDIYQLRDLNLYYMLVPLIIKSWHYIISLVWMGILSPCSWFWQVFFPFIVAGFGTVGAGMVLDIVQVNTPHIFFMCHRVNAAYGMRLVSYLFVRMTMEVFVSRD